MSPLPSNGKPTALRSDQDINLHEQQSEQLSSTDILSPAPQNTPGSSTRPSRNRERISYSDFYRIGLGKIGNLTPDMYASPPDQISKKGKMKPNILKFRVKSSTPIATPVRSSSNHERPNSTTTQGTSKVNDLPRLNDLDPPLTTNLADGKSENPVIITRDRAGTSPLSSVPSDLDDSNDASENEATHGRSMQSARSEIARPHLEGGNSPATLRAHTPSLKRPAPNSERGSLSGDRRPVKSKKIKISSPVKHRRDVPVELELMPQDSRMKSKLDHDNRARSKDSDTGSNDGHCSTCYGTGKLVCCDDCPRSFHFVCIEPPIEESDIPDAPYYCMSCWDKRFGFPDPEPGIFHSLMANELARDPSIYQLPLPIRSFFNNVTSGDFGVYQEAKDQKTLRKDRNGFAEEVDPHRLRDRQNRPVICYKCGESALGTPGIVSCDHCTAHWHFDCVDPPLHGPPNAYKNWMCPLHADDITPTTRQPRDSRVVDVSLRRGFVNTGDIDIEISEDENSLPNGTADSESEADIEDGIRWASATSDIPRIKYRLPAESVILDFLDHCRQTQSTEGASITQALPDSLGTLDQLVTIALQELKRMEPANTSSSAEERVQMMALKALLATKGKDKIMAFLTED